MVQLGRMVHFCVGHDAQGNDVWRPATVVHVSDAEKGIVNLKVDLDGMNDADLKDTNGHRAVTYEEAVHCFAWRTSVHEGTGHRDWRWPPRNT